MAARTKHELRCICSRRPLLAFYGADSDGQPYLHMKTYRQRQTQSESIHTGGTASIRCRYCYRWTKIRLTIGGERISPPTTKEPDVLAETDE